MSCRGSLKVLAIGLDAAEPSLIQQMMRHGMMPGLTKLVDQGRWLRVRSPAHIGSGSVWPTFITGTAPTSHGRYSEWIWRPEKMSLERYHGRDLCPFWKKLDESGIRVGVLDVPFATPVGLSSGFEVTEWWAHDSVLQSMQCGPEQIRSLIKEVPAHPLAFKRQAAVKPDDGDGLRQLTTDVVEGIRRRAALAQYLIEQTQPAFALIVFPETHHTGHQMWHTVDANHDLYSGQNLFSSEPLLHKVYSEIDRQISHLSAKAGKDAIVMVFSLHGMKAAFGSPAFLAELLCARGFSHINGWRSQSWAERRRSLLAEVKRRAPLSIRKVYYRLTPETAIQQVARPTMIPAYNWQKTRAFSLPTDQYGWLRINLEGREIEGSVPLSRYKETTDELEKMLMDVKDGEGQPLVHRVVRTVASDGEALGHRIPDLVIHWQEAAYTPCVRVENTHIETRPVGIKTGQHAIDGFCVMKGGCEVGLGTTILAQEMGSVITRLLV